MKKAVFAVVLSMTLALAISSLATAMFATPINLATDSEKADAVFAGHVVAKDHGSVDDQGLADITITFGVTRVLKGAAPADGKAIIKFRDQPGPTYVSPMQMISDQMLVVLNKEGDFYVFAKPALSEIAVDEKAYSPYQQSTDVTANLIWEMQNQLKSSSPKIVQAAIEQLGNLSKISAKTAEAVIPAMKPLLTSPDKTTRAQAISSLLKAGDTDAVLPALEYLKSQLEQGFYPRDAKYMDVQVTLEQTKILPEQLPAFVEAMSSKNAELRQIASFVLRSMQSSEALPYLKKALDDPDQQVRYNAVMGLAETTKDYEHGPAVSKFRENEQEYIDYWKNKDISSSE